MEKITYIDQCDREWIEGPFDRLLQPMKRQKCLPIPIVVQGMRPLEVDEGNESFDGSLSTCCHCGQPIELGSVCINLISNREYTIGLLCSNCHSIGNGQLCAYPIIQVQSILDPILRSAIKEHRNDYYCPVCDRRFCEHPDCAEIMSRNMLQKSPIDLLLDHFHSIRLNVIRPLLLKRCHACDARRVELCSECQSVYFCGGHSNHNCISYLSVWT